MMIDSFQGISHRTLFYSAVVGVFGLIAVLCATLLPVRAQTAPRGSAANADATVHVDVTPEHILNTIDPDTATGAWMDDLTKAQVDNLTRPETIRAVKNLGWGSITMRNNSELRLSAWHWNENGAWSDPAGKSGYFAGSAELGEPIHYGNSYSLPHRNFMTSGDAPLVAGPQSYWKSNPYLTRHFTGESDALHPQWVVIDMGMARAVDAIHIQWVNPYAVTYVVQYWIGDKNALDWDTGPIGVWTAFPSGTVTSGTGGDVHLRLCDKPVTARFVRVLMSKSSHTPDTHGAQDIRNCVGYALQTLSMGTINAQGTYSVVYPPNGVEPGPSKGPVARESDDEEAAAVFPGSAEDTAGSFCASSIDPWHGADNLVTGGHDMYNGIDNFFTSGLTMGHAALVPCTVIYGTPEDCANEVAYIHKRGYPVVGIEIGEECDGKHTMPEDYGALFCQWADAIHKLTPDAKLGGPVFEGVDKDITLWVDDEGRTSWMSRFIDYLKTHGHLQDLSFMSFEHYPLMVNGFSPPNDWDSLYLEPGIMKHVLRMWREDGVPREIPLIISESGITAGHEGRGYLGVTGRAIWECDAFGTFFEQGGTAFYRPAINDGTGGRWGGGGGPNGGGANGTPEYTPFMSAHLINFEWLQHSAGPNRIFPASADLMDAAGRKVITAYAVHRPDENWSFMLINHDLNAAHTIRMVIDDANHKQYSLVEPVALVQYCNNPDENKSTTMAPSPAGLYTLPAGSITVLRGKLK
ncbi:MAG TPA: discoidin domain-containing protein [Terriglobia bacterium]|nr:discoidin domain-containing protein [Terriglobia bacterium]